MYSAIASNARRSWLLIAVFVAFVLGLGWLLDQYFQAGGAIIVIAFVWSLISALVSYYAGDKVALWTAGAKPIEKRDAPDLYNVVENLCIAEGVPTPKIYIINDPSPNAFATGRDPAHASIAFTSGLVQMMDKSELQGVAAHELSHVKNNDIRLMTMVVVLVGTVTLITQIFVRTRWIGGGGNRRNEGGIVVLILGLVAIIVAPIVANLIKLAVSRRREYLADASGALLTRYPEGLANALEKIGAYGQPLQHASAATAHLYIANPFGSRPSGIANLFSTHPPLADRIKALREMGNQP